MVPPLPTPSGAVTGPGPHTRMECLQVWGGSAAADTAVSTTGLDVWLYSKPYRDHHEGGDVYHLSSCSSGRITRLVLADVRGHGAHVVRLARQVRGLMGRHINRIDHGALVRSINREFAADGDPNTFATGLVATYFVPTGRLTLSNAGHPAPLRFDSGRGVWSRLEQPRTSDRPADVPLGMFDATAYSQISVPLGTSDGLLCYTDGLEDSVDRDGAALGADGVLRLVRDLGDRAPEAIIPALVDRVRSLSPDNLSDDDVTIMLVRPNGASVALRDNLLAPFRYLAHLLTRQVGTS